MSEFANTIELLGDEAVTDSILERTITEFKDNLATTLAQYIFYGCTELVTVVVPSVTRISTYVFYDCTKLVTVDAPSVTSISTYVFTNCSSLLSLVLRSDTVCTLSNTNTLTSTPIASGTGYIYVPSALLDSYKAATNWSTYADQFRALEDYTVDGTTTGELDESKTSA